MRQLALTLTLVVSLSWSWSCAKKSAPTNGPRATVTLRTGDAFTGVVTASSPAEITIAGDDNQTHTFQMANVRSVDYAETAAPPPAQQAQQQPPPQPTPVAQQPPPQSNPDLDEPHHYHPDASAIRTRTYVIPAGAQVSVRTEETIDSSRAVEGQTYPAEVTRDVLDADGAVVVPRGSNAQIVIRSASGGGRFRGRSDLVLDLGSVSVDGREYRLETSEIVRTGKEGVGANRRTAKFAGSGAAIGAIIGAIAGHGKGAAIGAASGAGAGLVGQVVTKGAAIRVPVESVLTFRLEAPLHVTSAQ